MHYEDCPSCDAVDVARENDSEFSTEGFDFLCLRCGAMWNAVGHVCSEDCTHE